jgi:CHASE3 domain sensor protein
MKIKRDTISLWGMGLGLLLLASVGVFSDRRTQDLDESNKWVSHTLEVIGDTEQVKANLIETEDSMRGYILFRRGSDLERVRELVTRIPTELLKIRQLTSDNIRQQDRLTLLEPLASRRLVLLEDEIPFATDSSEKSAELKAIYEQGQVAMQGSHKILNEMENEERMLLVNRQERATHEKSMATLLIDGGFITSILFVFGAGGLGQLEIARRHRMEAVLNTANNNITNNFHEAQERGRERSILSELAERLQSCRNLAEGLPFMRGAWNGYCPMNPVRYF